MNKLEHYNVVLEDAEKKLELIQEECVTLRKMIENKQALAIEAEHTIAFIKNEMIPYVKFVYGEKVDADTQPLSDPVPVSPKLKMLRDLTVANNYDRSKQSKISIADGSELILEETGKPMHADLLIAELGKIGRFGYKANIVSTIRKDHKLRFINLGKNIWDLRRRQEQQKNEKEENV